MATGVGRQRFDFTNADVTVMADAASGGSPTPSNNNDEQLVRLVADQWQELKDALVGLVKKSESSISQIRQAIEVKGGPSGGAYTRQDEARQRELAAFYKEFTNNLASANKSLGLFINSSTEAARSLRNLNRPSFNAKDVNEPIRTSFFEQLLNVINASGVGTSRGQGVLERARGLGSRLTEFSQDRSLRSGSFSRSVAGAAGNVGSFISGITGAGSMIAKLAGPVGVAFTGVQMAAGLVKAGFDAVASAVRFAADSIRFLGDAAIKVARNDGIGLIASGANAAAGALNRIPIVGGLLASSFELVSAGLTTFKSVLDSFTARGRELSRYNPVIAMAAATADVRKIFADMREANQNAAKYADLIIKSQQLDESFQRALQPLKEAVMRLLIKVMPILEGIAIGLGQFFEELPVKLQYMSDALSTSVSWDEANNRYLESMLEIQRKREAKENENKDIAKMFPDMLRQAMESVQLEPAAPKQGGPNKDALRFPLFQM